MKVSVNITNNISNAMAALNKGIENGMSNVANFLVEESKSRAPVKTGKLRDSINVETLTPTSAVVATGDDVPYAYYQHEYNPNGHEFYMRNALLENENPICEIMKNSIEQALNSL